LVHGGWADGASWSGVIQRLQAKGYNSSHRISPRLDSGRRDHLRQILKSLNGRRSSLAVYGGEIMTALGTDAPNVVG